MTLSSFSVKAQQNQENAFLSKADKIAHCLAQSHQETSQKRDDVGDICQEANESLQPDEQDENIEAGQIEFEASIGVPFLENVQDYNPKTAILSSSHLEIKPIREGEQQGEEIAENYQLQAIDIMIEFDYDSAIISNQEADKIDLLYQAFQSDILQDISFIFLGHTDSRGDEDYNCALSKQRAKAVKQALIAKGLSPFKIQVIGAGEYLLKDKQHPEAAQNRRVSFIKHYPEIAKILPSLKALCGGNSAK